MGNLVSCGLGHASSKHVVKLVHCNGLVEEFYRPVRVCELSIDYPHHSICHSDALSLVCAGCELPRPSLSDDDDMEVGQIYFLLPRKLFESPLTQADIAALLSKAAVARKASYKGLHMTINKQVPPLPPPQPDVEMTKLHDDTAQEFVQRLLAETQLHLQSGIAFPTPTNLSLTAPELQPAYARHIVARSCASRPWKPPLETIEEGNFIVP